LNVLGQGKWEIGMKREGLDGNGDLSGTSYVRVSLERPINQPINHGCRLESRNEEKNWMTIPWSTSHDIRRSKQNSRPGSRLFPFSKAGRILGRCVFPTVLYKRRRRFDRSIESFKKLTDEQTKTGPVPNVD
jgi:hypothetical protein